MNISGLPPEFQDLLERLQRRGLPVAPLAIARLRHLFGVPGAVDTQDLLPLLNLLLAKNEAQRTLLYREFGCWCSEWEHTLEPRSETNGDGLVQMSGMRAAYDTTGLGKPGMDDQERPSIASWDQRRWRWVLAGLAAALPLLLWVLWISLYKPQPAVSSPPDPPVITYTTGTAPDQQVGLCPQDLPTEAVSEVWAWIPIADYRPWIALAGGLLLLPALLIAGRRLLYAKDRYLSGRRTDTDMGPAPRHGLRPARVPGDLLLQPAQRREMVWAIDRFVSEESSSELDISLSVTATARAAGEPHLFQRPCSFPREVWLWYDRKSGQRDLQERLLAEVHDALVESNLPVRTAHYHGLPTRLQWDDGHAPFTPAYSEGAGAQAFVVVLSDGIAWQRSWDNPGEQTTLQRLLHELCTWPRLCLVDLSADGRLSAYAQEWRMEVRRAQGLSAWLAGQLRSEERAPVPDPAQVDLWVAAWLLVEPPCDHATAQALRLGLELHLDALAYGVFKQRLAECMQDRALGDRLVNRLARSQDLDDGGHPEGDGYFTRALKFWDRRYAQSLQALEDAPGAHDHAGHERLAAGRARLLLWSDPEAAADELLDLAHGNNATLIQRFLSRHAAADALFKEGDDGPDERRPAWHLADLPADTQVRLQQLGFQPHSRRHLRLAVHQHLALAVLGGMVLAALVWGLWRVLMPGSGGHPVYRNPLFDDVVRSGEGLGGTWRGSPWWITKLPGLGPLDTPYKWQWRRLGQENPLSLGLDAVLYVSGTQAFPIRGCEEGWPKRSLAVIQAEPKDEDARRLAIRLLDRGAADRVLIGLSWGDRIDDLTQGLSLPDDQLLVFVPPAAESARPIDEAGFTHAAVITGMLEQFAAAVDFPGVRAVQAVWPDSVRSGRPRIRGGPETWADPATGLSWIHVCGGTFSMGSPDEEDQSIPEYVKQWKEFLGGELDERLNQVTGWMRRERPRHPVLLQDYWITRTEVTGDGAMPLVEIDWRQAQALCGQLSPPVGTDAWESGLVTEAQWEYAARAGTATRWSFGQEDSDMGRYAWYEQNAQRKTHPVEELKANGMCLTDLHGNVWEWTRDCFESDAYASRDAPLVLDPLVAPDPLVVSDSRVISEPQVYTADCDSRVVRGGSFGLPSFFLRSTYRNDDGPEARSDLLGLRCVRARARQP